MKMREILSKISAKILWFCFLVNLWTFGLTFDAKAFDDTVLFKLNWPGKDSFDALASEQIDIYDGPTALDLLTPLFTQSSCSYRLESYWTYELCHGRYIRQYHEEREGKKHKLQEYFLGKWDKKQLAEMKEKLDQQGKSNPATLPVKKIDGLSLPYLQINMSDGTMCDLNGKPRMTRVQYVCYIHGKHEVYSLKEASTCEYEAVVLSPFLCQHPDYRPQETGEHPISCLPVDNAPKKPKELLSMEAESLKLRHQRQSDEEVNAEYFWQDDKLQKMYAVFSIDRDGDNQDGEARVRVEIRPMEMLADTDALTEGGNVATNPTGPPVPAPPPLEKEGPTVNFMSGKDCITGGTGWWRYELCYGRSVSQYHDEKDGTRTRIELGRFNIEKHREWLEQNPHKKPRPLAQRKQLSHFYSEGSFCEKTGKPRQVEVKLKCLEDASPNQVGLYLLEPKVCEYLLGVESPAVCDLLPLADDDGLVQEMLVEVPTETETPEEEVEEEVAAEVQSSTEKVEEVQNEHVHQEL
ncbi:hypothetical protein B566_EDAN001318 [Ephemera danica]|nr:hypothetical protein B566_EDAN001318 [Ephemera danica]